MILNTLTSWTVETYAKDNPPSLVLTGVSPMQAKEITLLFARLVDCKCVLRADGVTVALADTRTFACFTEHADAFGMPS